MAEISIDLRSNPAPFEAGVKVAEQAMEEWERAAAEGADDIAEKLEQVIRALVTLGTESGKTKDEMVRDLGTFGLSAEQAEDAVRAVWDEMAEGRAAARDVEKASESLKDVKTNAEEAADATKKVGDGAADTGSRMTELGGIARDVLSGDFGSAAEGAISALGTLGAFAGAAGALAGLIGEGVGSIVGDFIGQWERAAEESKQRISSMYADMLESGRSYLSEDFVAKRIAEIYDPENVEEYNRALEISNQLGIERQTVIQAMAGDEEANADVLSRSRDRLADLIAEQEAYIDANGRESSAIADKIGEIEIGIDAYGRLAGEQETAAGKAREAADAINQAGGAAATTAGKIDGVALALASLPANVTIAVDADTSRFFAQMEAVRREAFELDSSIGNQRRGRLTV